MSTCRHREPHGRTLAAVAGAVAATVGVVLAVSGGSARAAADPCVRVPAAGAPVWVEYGEGSVPAAVREIFLRPGVTVAASGTLLPARYRARGAQTVYWVLKLPSLVGDAGRPADPATIDAAADRTYDLAVRSTLCPTPLIALNELAGPGSPVPWTESVRTYRANVLALVRRLAERGAVPVLLIHGNPVFAGEAAPWWREVGALGHVVYEAYYKAPNIARLGRIVGPRRVRLGMRSIVRSLVAAGVPRRRIGLMLGFQTSPGKAGREGLQPSSAWFRYVKWNALAARQVAEDERLTTIWSWGWGTLGPNAADPDKPAAACVYLWARNSRLCDGKTAAGPGFDASLVEGPIAVPDAHQCLSVAGKLPRATVAAHVALTRDLDAAITATFVRQVLRKAIAVPSAEVTAAEDAVVARAFGGLRDAYLAELQRSGVSVAVARGILEDSVRRERIAALAGPLAPLTWVADRVSAAIETATCRGDRLPGGGDFPRTDRRESAGVPLGAALPFLLDDRVAPAAPAAVTAALVGPGAQLTWLDGIESDLLGYHVYRALSPDGPFTRLTRQPWPRPAWLDAATPAGAVYVVRAVDAAGNLSQPAPVVPASPPIAPSG